MVPITCGMRDWHRKGFHLWQDWWPSTHQLELLLQTLQSLVGWLWPHWQETALRWPLLAHLNPLSTPPVSGCYDRFFAWSVSGGNWPRWPTQPLVYYRDLEFEIIGDYTHPSPFLPKKKRKSKICLIPHSGAASEGVQGWLASIIGLNKGQNIRNREGFWL